ncbi:phage tail tape measure protein [Aeromonas dhakensis]|uniref:phage tail tape measure protein n=1 Tax=Aeromonas dhakensis TaxID=196024 RepID=UPI001AAE95BF|nr:phage tail tape measure protein [Aeromonas dhakensis]MBO2901163.1 phage tail tape measure protein [Aeromonas dhakensis]MBO2995950.1 phage tail tape measure protein [Aeromonas dhakensis]
MNPLKLQILLGAVDKLTAPLKTVSGQSRLTAKDLVDTKKRIKELETQSSQIEGYRTLGRQIGATRTQLTQAQRDAQQMAQQLAQVEQPTKAMTRAMEQAKQKVRDLSQQEREMVARHGSLKRAMNEAGINTRQLGEHQHRLKTDLAAANVQLDQQRAKLGQLADQQKRLNQVKASYRQTQELRGQIAGHGATAIAAGTAIGMPVYSAIKEYSSFEDAMKGVAKQVDGARDDSGKLTQVYFDMAKEIQAIAEEIPQLNGAIDIAALVEGAARMGVQGQENLLKFARTSAKAATAFELPAGQLAEDMGKIANLYKIPIGNIEELGDAINYLDDNAQSKGADIIDVLQRLGGVADKLDFRKAAALGSTFLSLGAAPEIAASASNAMVRELSIATMQSKRFQAGMKAIGMQSTAVEKAMATDAMGTITKVLEKIKKLNVEDQLRVTTQIFGKEYGKDAAKLSNNLDELYRQLKLVNAEKSRGSMQRESDIDKDSLSSQWLILQAGIRNVKADLGEKLRGSLMDIIKYIKQIVVGVRHWVEENPELANTLVRVAAVTSVIAIAMGGLSLAVATLLGPLAIMKLIFGVLGVTFGGMLGAIGALLAPLAALAALGIAIIKFWQPISAFFSGLWQGIMTGLAPVFEAFKPFAPLIDGLGTGVKALSGWFGDLLEPIKFSKKTLEGFGSAGQFVGRILGEAFNLALTPLKAFLKGIEWLLESLGILEAKKLPSFQMTAPTASTPGYLNGNFGSPALSSGYSYGPRIVPTPVPKPVAARGGNTTTTHQWTIVQQPGETPDDLVRKIDQRIEQRERQAAARGRATLGDRN